MDVREKLVKLIDTHCDYAGQVDCLEDCTKCLADHLIAHGVTVQEWISVKDRLPKPFEDVLVFRDGKVSIDYHEEDGWFAYDFNGERATHWMPLPPPPKGE